MKYEKFKKIEIEIEKKKKQRVSVKWFTSVILASNASFNPIRTKLRVFCNIKSYHWD